MNGSEILSMAIFRAQPGHEAEALSVTLELSDLFVRKSYAHDTLLHQPGEHGDFVLIRRWVSEQARLQAHEDPEAHRYWLRMGQILQTLRVYEELDEVVSNPEV